MAFSGTYETQLYKIVLCVKILNAFSRNYSKTCIYALNALRSSIMNGIRFLRVAGDTVPSAAATNGIIHTVTQRPRPAVKEQFGRKQGDRLSHEKSIGIRPPSWRRYIAVGG